ncbi:hypothetical protein GJ496_011246 [Pomphorhynchus laevis]|nr:hypothetical protein GJ496_011246 [Pomphorhynchus laevis]
MANSLVPRKIQSWNNISGDITKSNRENQNYSVSSIDTEPLKIRIRLGAKPAVSNPSSLCQSDSVAENKSDPIVSPNEAIRSRRKQAKPQHVKGENEITNTPPYSSI